MKLEIGKMSKRQADKKRSLGGYLVRSYEEFLETLNKWRG
jgi:hypothetical protein